MTRRVSSKDAVHGGHYCAGEQSAPSKDGHQPGRERIADSDGWTRRAGSTHGRARVYIWTESAEIRDAIVSYWEA